jgi:hypothetical protein
MLTLAKLVLRSRVLEPQRRRLSIIPVEPEQGNACAGKVVNIVSFTTSLSQHFLNIKT